MHEAKEVDSFRVANVLEIDGRGGFQVGDAASFVTGRQYMVTRSIRTPDPGRDACGRGVYTPELTKCPAPARSYFQATTAAAAIADSTVKGHG